jgi:hypothetical protein
MADAFCLTKQDGRTTKPHIKAYESLTEWVKYSSYYCYVRLFPCKNTGFTFQCAFVHTACVYVCACVSIHAYICVCVCVCVWGGGGDGWHTYMHAPMCVRCLRKHCLAGCSSFTNILRNNWTTSQKSHKKEQPNITNACFQQLKHSNMCRWGVESPYVINFKPTHCANMWLKTVDTHTG